MLSVYEMMKEILILRRKVKLLEEGGGGANTPSLLPVTGTETATGAVIGELAGNALTVTQAGNEMLHLDPTAGAEASFLGTYNTTGGGNISGFAANNSNIQPLFTIFADFNGGVESATISGSSQSGSSALQYLATTHTFTGVPEYADNAAASGAGLVVGTIYRTGDLMKIVH